MKTEKKVLIGGGIAVAIALLWYAFKPKKITVNNAQPALSGGGGGGGITTTLPSYVPGLSTNGNNGGNSGNSGGNSGNSGGNSGGGITLSGPGCNPLYDKGCVPEGTGGIKPLYPTDDSGDGVYDSPGHVYDQNDNGGYIPNLGNGTGIVPDNSNSFWAGGTYCDPRLQKCDPNINW